MDQRRSQPHPLELEQWLLEEQSPGERAHTEARLDAGEGAQHKRDDAALRARLLESCPPEQLARLVGARLEVQAQAARHAVRSSRRYMFGAALVAGCALLALLRTSEVHDGSAALGDRGGERVKGVGLELRVFRQRSAGIERLVSGTEVAAHEVLQLGYARGGFTHGVLLSIDGRGGVTLHAPREPGESTALSSRSEHLLSEAYELDDAPAFERFIIVVADQPLSVEQVLGAARALAADPGRARTAQLEVTTPNEQRSLLVRKSAER
jgi:hypothetical protein